MGDLTEEYIVIEPREDRPIVPAVPSGKDLYLISHHVAGTTHRPEIKEIAETFQLNQRLKLVHEQNAYDSFAVRIMTETDEKIGYLPMGKNEIIARMLDDGKTMYAKIERWEAKGQWLRIIVGIYLAVEREA